MLPDFEMIIHKFPEREDITIIPIADVHLGARECMEQEFIISKRGGFRSPGGDSAGS